MDNTEDKGMIKILMAVFVFIVVFYAIYYFFIKDDGVEIEVGDESSEVIEVFNPRYSNLPKFNTNFIKKVDLSTYGKLGLKQKIELDVGKINPFSPEESDIENSGINENNIIDSSAINNDKTDIITNDIFNSNTFSASSSTLGVHGTSTDVNDYNL